jgi:hypothetical protein
MIADLYIEHKKPVEGDLGLYDPTSGLYLNDETKKIRNRNLPFSRKVIISQFQNNALVETTDGRIVSICELEPTFYQAGTVRTASGEVVHHTSREDFDAILYSGTGGQIDKLLIAVASIAQATYQSIRGCTIEEFEDIFWEGVGDNYKRIPETMPIDNFINLIVTSLRNDNYLDRLRYSRMCTYPEGLCLDDGERLSHYPKACALVLNYLKNKKPEEWAGDAKFDFDMSLLRMRDQHEMRYVLITEEDVGLCSIKPTDMKPNVVLTKEFIDSLPVVEVANPTSEDL